MVDHVQLINKLCINDEDCTLINGLIENYFEYLAFNDIMYNDRDIEDIRCMLITNSDILFNITIKDYITLDNFIKKYEDIILDIYNKRFQVCLNKIEKEDKLISISFKYYGS